MLLLSMRYSGTAINVNIFMCGGLACLHTASHLFSCVCASPAFVMFNILLVPTYFFGFLCLLWDNSACSKIKSFVVCIMTFWRRLNHFSSMSTLLVSILCGMVLYIYNTTSFLYFAYPSVQKKHKCNK